MVGIFIRSGAGGGGGDSLSISSGRSFLEPLSVETGVAPFDPVSVISISVRSPTEGVGLAASGGVTPVGGLDAAKEAAPLSTGVMGLTATGVAVWPTIRVVGVPATEVAGWLAVWAASDSLLSRQGWSDRGI